MLSEYNYPKTEINLMCVNYSLQTEKTMLLREAHPSI